MSKLAVENVENAKSSSKEHAGDGIHHAAQQAWEPRPITSDSNEPQQPTTNKHSMDFSAPIATGYPTSDVSPSSTTPGEKGNPASDVSQKPITGTNPRVEGEQPSIDKPNESQNFNGEQSPAKRFEQKQQPSPSQMYQIQAGDNLWNIAGRAQSGAETSPTPADTAKLSGQIAMANKLSNPNLIKPGEQIQIPKI